MDRLYIIDYYFRNCYFQNNCSECWRDYNNFLFYLYDIEVSNSMDGRKVFTWTDGNDNIYTNPSRMKSDTMVPMTSLRVVTSNRFFPSDIVDSLVKVYSIFRENIIFKILHG